MKKVIILLVLLSSCRSSVKTPIWEFDIIRTVDNDTLHTIYKNTISDEVIVTKEYTEHYASNGNEHCTKTTRQIDIYKIGALEVMLIDSKTKIDTSCATMYFPSF